MTPGSAEQRARITLIALLVVAIVLIAMLLAPFATPLYLAAVLAGVLHPTMTPLTRRLHVKPGFAAALLTLGVLVAVVLPLGWLGTVFVQQGIRAVSATRDLFAGRSVEELLARLPAPLETTAAWLRPRIEHALPQMQDALGSALQALAQRVPGWLARSGAFVGEAALMLIALYALLIDGPRLVEWLGSVTPLPRARFDALLAGFRRVASAVLVSTLLIAVAQALATLAGFLIVRAPQPVFFAFVAFLIAFIPVLSPGLVSLGMAVALLVEGRWIAALVLALWTLGVVMTVDNWLRPILLQRGIGLHPTVLLFAVLGGVVAFGPIGVVAGPMVLSFFIAMVELCHQEFAAEGGAASGTDVAGG
ncbi:MAG: AI-2E family transporter [Candidatus Eisenbacteria bacterium]